MFKDESTIYSCVEYPHNMKRGLGTLRSPCWILAVGSEHVMILLDEISACRNEHSHPPYSILSRHSQELSQRDLN